MQNSIVKFVDIEIECQPGITDLYTESLGMVTFVGWSAQGDAIIQIGKDGFSTIPEVTWNLMEFNRPFEAETHVRYLKQSDLELLHDDTEKIIPIELAERKSMVYQYEAVITIKKVYDKLGERQ